MHLPSRPFFDKTGKSVVYTDQDIHTTEKISVLCFVLPEHSDIFLYPYLFKQEVVDFLAIENTSLLSIKDSRDILISVNYTINLYILVTDLVDNHIIFPYRIFIICPKTDSF